MATTRADIRRWLERGKKYGATHVIVMVDSYDHEDYPVYVLPNTKPLDELARIQRETSMQRPMECYNLAFDWDMQLNEYRANHWN